MKVGILTFHNSDNYGSVLQAYALTSFINNLGEVNCEIINFIPPNQEELYAIYLPVTSLKNIIKNMRALLFSKLLKKRKEAFHNFRESRLFINSHKIYDPDELIKYLNKFDCIICGSDQIWNPLSSDFSTLYFLPGYMGKKIAYAPSFGNCCADDFKEKADFVCQCLEKFDALSVRELAGKKVIADLKVKKSVCRVLDPTFLLKSIDWDDLLEKCTPEKESYIFFYSIDFNPEAIKMVRFIARQMNMPVKIMFTTNKTYRALANGFKLIDNTAPEAFINTIKNADIVLSSSFHGTAFSVIYRKNFYALECFKNGKLYKDERLHTLLSEFRIPERIINQYNYKKIDWKHIPSVNYCNDLIEKQRNNSISYIVKGVIQNCERI